jgi:F0F1-type ATP synthase assembly protein I
VSFCNSEKKHKEKGKEVVKKEKKKSHQQEKRKKETKGNEEKNSEVLASFCGLMVSCILVCLI